MGKSDRQLLGMMRDAVAELRWTIRMSRQTIAMAREVIDAVEREENSVPARRKLSHGWS